MSSPIASLFVEIGAETTGVQKGLQQTENMLTGAAATLGKFALGVGVAGFAALAGGIAKSIQSASEAEQGQAQLAAVIKSTGGVAGVTADMANDLASSLQNVTRFSDDSIISGENLLLTFTNIGKDIFPQATETMLDMSQALGQDLKSSALQLGKALQDPIEGVSALRRVGVNFTDDQEKMIKSLVESGKSFEAQKLILQELQKEFGGVAQAAGDTFAGKMDILGNKFDDIMEKVGGHFLPFLEGLADKIISAIDNPEVQKAIDNFTTALGQLTEGNVSGALITLGFDPQFVTQLQSIGDTLRDLGPKAQDAAGQIQDAFGTRQEQFSEVGGQYKKIFDDIVDALSRISGMKINGADLKFPTLEELVGMQIDQYLLKLRMWAMGWEDIKKGAAGVAQAFNDVAAADKELMTLTESLRKAFVEGLSKAFDDFRNTYLTPFVASWQMLGDAVKGVVDWLNELAAILGVDVGKGFMDILHTAGVPGFAAGGEIGAGHAAIVGERGPELFVPRSNGTIIPNGALGGATIYITYAPTVSLMDESEARDKLAPFIRAALAA